jgi:hypothetical protein
MKPNEFHPAVSKLLDAKLQPIVSSGRELNLVTCVEIYQTIFDTLVELLTESQVNISNESMNFLAQQYYDAVKVNGTQELDPEIFTQRASLDAIETKELALLAVMLSGTDFAIPVIQTIKRRS